jgi:hypothetical protein
MTTLEACTLATSLTMQLSSTRGERDSWRLLCLAQMDYIADLTREIEMLDVRSYVHRTRTQDRLDVFLDQRDLRIEEAA